MTFQKNSSILLEIFLKELDMFKEKKLHLNGFLKNIMLIIISFIVISYEASLKYKNMTKFSV